MFSFVAPLLNDFENHRTETEYEDNLIFKIFTFKVINSYSAIIYLGFVKPFLTNTSCSQNVLGASCTVDVELTLRFLFIVDLIGRVIRNVILKIVSYNSIYCM